ncbi:MAG: hypothetical protein AAFP03_08085 [Cyanobacteria bacterium J06598_3]
MENRKRYMKILKPILGISLVATIIWLGVAKAGQWLVLPLGALMTAAYINGKGYAWSGLFKQPSQKLYQLLAVTYVIETLLTYGFYWLGRGIMNLLIFLSIVNGN